MCVFMQSKKPRYTVQITKDTHTELKIYCAKYNLKMVDYVDWIIQSAIGKQAKPIDKLEEVA